MTILVIVTAYAVWLEYSSNNEESNEEPNEEPTDTLTNVHIFAGYSVLGLAGL